MDWYLFFPFLLLGTIFGSFLNVIIYRLPRSESIAIPRSYCPNCRQPIPIYRNIPIFSFLVQRGKCADCSAKISWQYPLVELINGIIWGWSFSVNDPASAIYLAALGSILLAIAWIDYQHLIIPLSLNIGALLIVVFAIAFKLIYWRVALWGMLAGIGIPAVIVGMIYISSGKIGMGLGDIQLGLILGLWLGPIGIVMTLLLASMLTIIIWGILHFKTGWDKNRPLPFAPYLIISSFIVYISSYYQSDFIRGLLLN
ncbi:MAG: prepilin peptidase [Candidatus Marinimicrobia bacterium]|nr:prepilin peptidase [Candidatus Neomarinimicrobiota bacterium]